MCHLSLIAKSEKTCVRRQSDSSIVCSANGTVFVLAQRNHVKYGLVESSGLYRVLSFVFDSNRYLPDSPTGRFLKRGLMMGGAILWWYTRT